MSDAAFAEDAAEDLNVEDAELESQEDDLPEETEEEAPKAKDWQKIAHDKEGALAKERSRRKAEQQRARELEQRLEKLENAKPQGASDDDIAKLIASIRDDDDDPIGDLAGIKQVLRKFMSERDAEAQMERTRNEQQRAVQQITNRMAEAEADFADDNPDYYDAAKFFRDQRREELEDLGYGGAKLNQELNNDLLGIVSRALQAGRDPAEAVYNLAKKRGFGVDGVAKKLQTLQRGQGASRSLSTAGGKTAATELTPASVSNLKGAAFDAAFAKLRAQQRRAS